MSREMSVRINRSTSPESSPEFREYQIRRKDWKEKAKWKSKSKAKAQAVYCQQPSRLVIVYWAVVSVWPPLVLFLSVACRAAGYALLRGLHSRKASGLLNACKDGRDGEGVKAVVEEATEHVG
jgi:hypothetical protein